MGDIAAYMKNEKLMISEIMLTPQELFELIASIKEGTISGKIGKQVITFMGLMCLIITNHSAFNNLVPTHWFTDKYAC